jgi:TIR domain
MSQNDDAGVEHEQISLSAVYRGLDDHLGPDEAPYDVGAGLERLMNWMGEEVQPERARVRSTGLVFISYVREDSHRVDRLQQVFEAAGVRVWQDKAELLPGDHWRTKIRRAITDNAAVFIACFSHASLTGSKCYQDEELTLAIEQMRLRRRDDQWLIPVRFDECEIPERDIGGGRTLTSIQRADLFGDGFDDNAARLTEAVRRILVRQAA